MTRHLRNEPQRITLFLVEDFTHLAFSCAVEPFRIANLLSGRTLYRWQLASEDGHQARASNGIVTLVDRGMEPLAPGEMLFILSGIHVERHISPALKRFIRYERSRGTRIGALCSGAMVLAEAGLMAGEPAAIHWAFHDGFVESFPDIQLKRSVFVADTRHPTASGGTATADLMLHLIAAEHGNDLALAVADQMVYNAVRDGTGEQRLSVEARHGIRNAHVVEAIRMMGERLDDPPSPSEIATARGISMRQLERLFERHVKCSPKKYATDMRLEKARNLLLQTESSVTDIALACGFGSSSNFSRVYRARYGVTPTMARAQQRFGPSPIFAADDFALESVQH